MHATVIISIFKLKFITLPPPPPLSQYSRDTIRHQKGRDNETVNPPGIMHRNYGDPSGHRRRLIHTREYRSNVRHLGMAFFLVYTAFSGIQNLSSSLIRPAALGSATIGLLYAVFAASCLLGPALVARLGERASLVLGFAAICFFCVAYMLAATDDGNATLNWPLLLLAGAAVGFAASPIWVAQGSFITAQAKLWSKADPPARRANPHRVGSAAHAALEEAVATSIPRMGEANAIFFVCFQATQISGNLLPSLLLHGGATDADVFLVYLCFAAAGTLVASRLGLHGWCCGLGAALTQNCTCGESCIGRVAACCEGRCGSAVDEWTRASSSASSSSSPGPRGAARAASRGPSGELRGSDDLTSSSGAIGSSSRGGGSGGGGGSARTTRGASDDPASIATKAKAEEAQAKAAAARAKVAALKLEKEHAEGGGTGTGTGTGSSSSSARPTRSAAAHSRTLSAEVQANESAALLPVWASVRNMVRAWAYPRLYSLLPLIMYSGLEMGFIWGDFTANYVKPTLGKADIGYVMCVFGVSDIFYSFALGRASDDARVGRMPVLALGAAAQLAIMLYALRLRVPDCSAGAVHAAMAANPTEAARLAKLLPAGGFDASGACLAWWNTAGAADISDDLPSDFGDGTSWWLTLGVMAHVWAIGDAAWNTQLNSIISETFAADPAPGFANLKLWQSAMTGAAFFYNDSLAGADKLYIMLAMLGLGCLGLLNLHFNAGRKKRSASPKLPDVMSESQTANETGADAL